MGLCEFGRWKRCGEERRENQGENVRVCMCCEDGAQSMIENEEY